ncbi:MAG: hypothetical protein NTX30_05915 [Deltaproteobacteria bacterium]|nr:hypothetical protein [Deltaproteobacteria bacterium]
MNNINAQYLSDQDFFRLIEEANKQYELYLELNKIASIGDNYVVVESPQRDMNHPLSIQITG